MADEFFTEPEPAYSKGRKFWLEFKDILVGVAFPFILTLILSSTIIVNADYDKDLAISLLALIGGEIMYIAVLILFGRANGSAAYKKTLFHAQKKELGANEEEILYGTGEYALWKGAVIGAIICIPFIIFQIIELCYHNTFCSFCLRYACAWAFYPFSYLGEDYEALNFICIIIPIGAHTLGYYLGKLRQIKIQQGLDDKDGAKKRRKK